jgi:hypothetical protein
MSLAFYAEICKYPTIQSAMDDPSCQTIQLEGGFYHGSATTIDRDVTIIGGSADEPSHVGLEGGSSAFTILPGNTLTLEDLHIEGATGELDGAGIHNQGTLILNRVAVHNNGAEDGGGIYNLGTLTLNEGSSVYSNLAQEDGGGIYNLGTLYLCGGTVEGNQAPRGTVNNISGDPAQECPTVPLPGESPEEEGKWVLISHKGKKELCLPEAALKGRLNRSDEVIDEEGCFEETEPGGRRGVR